MLVGDSRENAEGGMKLFRVVAPHFVAGYLVTHKVQRTAPILKILRGMSAIEAFNYCIRRGWMIQEIA